MATQNNEPLVVSLERVLLGDTTKDVVDKINNNNEAIINAIDWVEENAGKVEDVLVNDVSVVGNDKIARINSILHAENANNINAKQLLAQGDTNKYPIAVLATQDYSNENGKFTQVYVPKTTVTIKNDTGDIDIGDKKVLTSADLGRYNTARGLGVASLGENGKIPTAQLPSFVDDVIDGYYNPVSNRFYTSYTTQNVTPAKDYYYIDVATGICYIFNNDALEEYNGAIHSDASHIIPGIYNSSTGSFAKYVFDEANRITPESNKIYVDLITNKTYRFNGNAGYVEISKQIALGETEATAYPGNKGKENAEEIDFIKYNFASVVNNDVLTQDELILGNSSKQIKSSGKKLVEYDLIGDTKGDLTIPTDKQNEVPSAYMLGYATREAMETLFVLDAFRRGKDLYASDHPDYHKLILIANRNTAITAADTNSAKAMAELMDRGFAPIRVQRGNTIIHTDIESSQSTGDDNVTTYTVKIGIDASLQEAFTKNWGSAIYFTKVLSMMQQNFYRQSSN